MAASRLFIFAAVLLAFASILSVQAEEPKSKPKCVWQDEGKDEEDASKKCAEELKDKYHAATETDKKELTRCYVTCEYRKLGWLTSDDKLDEAAFNAKIDKLQPEAARAGYKTEAKKCFESMTEKLTDDNNCKNHAAYQDCIEKAYYKNCPE